MTASKGDGSDVGRQERPGVSPHECGLDATYYMEQFAMHLTNGERTSGGCRAAATSMGNPSGNLQTEFQRRLGRQPRTWAHAINARQALQMIGLGSSCQMGGSDRAEPSIPQQQKAGRAVADG